MKHISRRGALGAALAVGLTGVLPGLTGTAQASHTVSCDSDLNVANHTYKLTGNLSCSIANAGIRITANGVTLDLNGFTISGVPFPVIEDKPGVLISGVTGARVTDSTTNATSFGSGTISNFDAGVAIVGGSANTVDKLNIVDNKSMELGSWGSGVHILNSSNNVVIDNKVLRNGPIAGVGVYETPGNPPGLESDGNVIGKTTGGSPLGGGNIISDNSQTVFNTNQDDGIRLEPGVDNNTVQNNTIDNNGLDGVAVFFGGVDGDKTSGNKIVGNRINNNGHHLLRHRKGDGIRVFGPNATQNADNNEIVGNRVCGNAASGIRVDGGRKWNNATLSWVGTKNKVQNNVAGNAATGCTNNVANAASPPGLNWDLADTNVALNATFGHPPCDSNAWNGNTTTGTVNDSCVLAP